MLTELLGIDSFQTFLNDLSVECALPSLICSLFIFDIALEFCSNLKRNRIPWRFILAIGTNARDADILDAGSGGSRARLAVWDID